MANWDWFPWDFLEKKKALALISSAFNKRWWRETCKTQTLSHPRKTPGFIARMSVMPETLPAVWTSEKRPDFYSTLNLSMLEYSLGFDKSQSQNICFVASWWKTFLPATSWIICRERLGGLLKHYFRQAAWSFKCLHFQSSGLAPEAPPCLNAGIQAGRWHNRRQIHRLQMIPSYENSCQNRFLPSQKWELGLHTSFRIGRG